ncbi:hypothetical protein V5E97_07845 [Singulisphaera sp. Ch08]|uniref:DUF2958 domain-containing protein n=1 Tax=Singulisphaera sp. Ch08 TaxID=3120278 RepID=A0AAU7CKG4_9BACT
MSNNWAFAESQTHAVVTLKQITEGEAPILLVYHEKGDGDWLFLDGGPFSVEEASLVPLQMIATLDPSIAELATLPPGWTARRSARDMPWQRSPSKELPEA